MAVDEKDNDTLISLVDDLKRYQKMVETLEFKRMFSGEADSCHAFLDIQAGSGGTEAKDCAEMILRMYLRWGEARGFKK
jgi:peptide chain release factor 2